MGNALARIARGAALLLVAVALGSFLQYAHKLALARLLDPAEVGRVSVAFALAGLLTAVAALGLPDGLARQIAKLGAPRAGANLSTGLALSLPLAFVFALGLLALARPLAELVFRDAPLAATLRVIAPVIPLQVATGVCVGAFRGLGIARYKAYAVDVVQPVVAFALVALLALVGASAPVAALVYVVAAGAMAGSALHLARKVAPPRVPGRAREPAGELLRFSAPLALAGFLWLVIAWTDVAIVGALTGPHEAGLLALALPTAQLLLVPLGALTYLFVPAATAAHVARDRAELGRLYRTMTRWLLIGLLPVCAFILIGAETLLASLFGAPYAEAAPALRLLAVGFVVAAVTGPAANLLVAVGRPRHSLAFGLIAAGGNAALAFALVPAHGIAGAALATALSLCAAGIYVVALAWRDAGAPASRGWASAGLATALGGGVAVWSLRFLPSGLTGLLAAGGTLGLTYGLALFATGGLAPEDRETLREALAPRAR